MIYDLFQIVRQIGSEKNFIMASKDQQINQLMDMGFGNNRVVRALQATQFKVAQVNLRKEEFYYLNFLLCRVLKLPWSGYWHIQKTPVWMIRSLKMKQCR